MFDNNLDRNSHILQHFVQEFCPKCNQNLIRIGENLYVLHGTITCIKAESEHYDHPHMPIELVQTSDDLIKDECGKDIFANETINFNDFTESQNKFEVFELELNPNELIDTTTSAKVGHLNYNAALAAIQDETKTVKKPKSRKSTTTTIDYNSQIVKCEIDGCDKVMSRNALTYHMSKHRGDRYECDICQASLSSKSGIRSHLLTHIQKDERLKCEICELTYATKSGLRKHQKFVHSNESKRFICTICGEGLRQPYLLKEHMSKHTGEKPFKCAYCEKSFRTKRLRSEHERIHTGEKPYKCMIDDCDRAFAYIIDLKRHKYTVHGIYTKQFTCQICSKIFSENMLLRKHMKSHNRIVQKKVKKFSRTKKAKT